MGKKPTRAVHYVLDGHASCVAEARRRVRSFLAAAQPPIDPRMAGNVELAVSELVSNAVRHAPGPCTLRLSDDGANLRIEVEDSNPQPPVDRGANLHEGNGGAGLRLLKALAGDVEVRTHPGGKTVSVTMSRSA